MPHDNHCSCGCHDHNHSHEDIKPPVNPATLTENQMEFLHQLYHRRYLPVARFTLTDSKESDFVSTALSPVYLTAAGDDMSTVKQAGAFLQKLEDIGLISLDYDLALGSYPYEEYKSSALYAYFCKTVAEGAGKPGFLGDTPVLELGSMALTEDGERIASNIPTPKKP